MNKQRFLPVLFAFLMAVSSAFVLNAHAALSTMKDGQPMNSPCTLGTLVQADTNCDTTDHGKGRCTVRIGIGVYDGYNSTNGLCLGPLYKIN